MGVVIAALISIAVVGAAILLVFSQPRPVWHAAAEHSRRFWLGWATASVAVGLLPVATGAFANWGAIVWLSACCAFALQPAMFADVLEVRRDIARRRRSLLRGAAAKKRRAGARSAGARSDRKQSHKTRLVP